jgi:hypothetical protein
MTTDEFRTGMRQLGWAILEEVNGLPQAYKGPGEAAIYIRDMWSVLCVLPTGPAKNGILRGYAEGLAWAQAVTAG